ncbi:MAG: flagellar hook-associated protein FlgK [Clostridia bacterium]|nr:flagellar hook-associated protein FlgK [Clostridia bacterium]
MSLTSSLYTACSGMSASQASLSVVSNNIINVDTEGYSRQRVNTASVYAATSASTTNIGGGVQIQSVESITDQFLRDSARDNNDDLGYWDTQNNYLSEIETSYGDIYGTTLQTATDDYLNAWDELSKDPSDQSSRALVYETGVALSDSINAFSDQIDAIEQSAITEVQDTVTDINRITASLASINEQISKNVSDDSLELVDAREALLDELSLLVDCTTNYQSDGTVDVISNNAVLVNGKTSQELSVALTPPSGMPVVQLESGNTYSNTGGSLGALTSLLDEDESPSFTEMRTILNDGIMSLVGEVNTLHQQGTGLDGETGIDFFVAIHEGEALGIGNLTVNALLEDVNKIGASLSGEEGDGEIATQISELQGSKVITYEGTNVTIDDYLAAYTEWLGTQTQVAEFNLESYTELGTQLQATLSEISSVSLDDEMSNMIMYQQTYNANANVMGIINELLDEMIQKLG